MGTNYYYRHNICECCKRYDEIHVGKSSFGWQFSFHGTDRIKSFKDWDTFINSTEGVLVDEYEQVQEWKDIKEFILSKQEDKKNKNHTVHCRHEYPGDSFLDDLWLDPEGYSFSSQQFS